MAKKNFSRKVLALLPLALAVPASATPLLLTPNVAVVQQTSTVSGVVKDAQGMPIEGASVVLVGTSQVVLTDAQGQFTLKNVKQGATIRVSLIGYKATTTRWTGEALNITLQELDNQFSEVVVTAMGIQRKEKSLTYSTQKISSTDLQRVQNANVANSLEGRVSGVTITPSAGGAGGASKIQLRGAKSILGNNAPLIVVDGIPMTNNTSNQKEWGDGQSLTYQGTTEGSDPLSMINPDDIEDINVLKGANASALYGSLAANGVLMITTKKGKEGRLDINVNSSVVFESPFVTPKIQNIYGSQFNGYTPTYDSWGGRLADITDDQIANSPARLRRQGADDIGNFLRTGVTTNNSVSVSGGTEKVKTYFSMANNHAKGMIPNNAYNRNTFAFRQSYELFNKRLGVDVSLNYVQTRTKNRLGGGTTLNPLYDIYLTPRNIDMGYYAHHYAKEDTWESLPMHHYVSNGAGAYVWQSDVNELKGTMQDWAYSLNTSSNNPYWLAYQNNGISRDERVSGYISGRLKVFEWLTMQARISANFDRSRGETERWATTRLPKNYSVYGNYYNNNSKSDEIYIDYLASFNKQFGDYSVSATAGWVGHTVHGEYQTFAAPATVEDGMLRTLPTMVNYFSTAAGGASRSMSLYRTSDWDRATILTAQVGWKDMVFFDASYRHDWYCAFEQFKHFGTPNNYGYFSLGGNAILSQLLRLPKFVNYLKYRLSYSEVGNSIPNILFNKVSSNLLTGAVNVSPYEVVNNPVPEKTKSFETGFEAGLFDSRLNVDLTYYNTAMHNSYLVITAASGRNRVVNTGVIRNQGIEASASYNWPFARDWQWRTGVNVSYNHNRIVETYVEKGQEAKIAQSLVGGNVEIRYKSGGTYGDMYAKDFVRNADGTIKLDSRGIPSLSPDVDKMVYIGNMNSKWQLGWSNTINYKDFSLFFLINGRIGGKIVSYTEAVLDQYGVSERTANARLEAERTGLTLNGAPAMRLPDGQLTPVEGYYREIGSKFYPTQYVYDATNFRLRELSLGYTFRNLFGDSKNLSVSFIARNLFFLYKDAPVDPDVAVSTQNGLSGFEVFSQPSARSFGFSVKMNF